MNRKLAQAFLKKVEFELKIKRAGASVEILELPAIEAEKSQIRQLFQNLISNSLKFHREEKPRIRIYARQVDDRWQIFMEDKGIGFDEKYLDRIFVPFQRLHGRTA